MVAHAATQDMEVLARACHVLPAKLFDTQVAAGSSAMAPPRSLPCRALHRCPPGQGRPLDRLEPEALDLPQSPTPPPTWLICSLLRTPFRASSCCRGAVELGGRGMRHRARASHSPTEPLEAWWKLRDNRHLQGASRAIAQEVAAWREERARFLDVQPRMVLPDLALLSVAHSPPATVAALRETRGIDARHLRGDTEEEIMAAVAKGRTLPPGELRLAQGEQMNKELRPAVSLASAWVAQLSRDEQVDAALLATRTDVVEYLSGKPGARLGEGWRAGLVGVPLPRLANGEASLALDGHGKLLLEERSNHVRGDLDRGRRPAPVPGPKGIAPRG